jgi:hypothetical protein
MYYHGSLNLFDICFKQDSIDKILQIGIDDATLPETCAQFLEVAYSRPLFRLLFVNFKDLYHDLKGLPSQK